MVAIQAARRYLADKITRVASPHRLLDPVRPNLTAPEPVHEDVTWVSSYEVDPFDVPLAEKTGLFAGGTQELLGARAEPGDEAVEVGGDERRTAGGVEELPELHLVVPDLAQGVAQVRHRLVVLALGADVVGQAAVARELPAGSRFAPAPGQPGLGVVVIAPQSLAAGSVEMGPKLPIPKAPIGPCSASPARKKSAINRKVLPGCSVGMRACFRIVSVITGMSTSGRSKEEATDYRYFPEPDLVPVAPDPAWVADLKAALPEAPSVRRQKLIDQLGLSDLDAQAMTNAGVLDAVLATVGAGAPAAEARNWWLGHLSQTANSRGGECIQYAVPAVERKIDGRRASGRRDHELCIAKSRHGDIGCRNVGSMLDAVCHDRAVCKRGHSDNSGIVGVEDRDAAGLHAFDKLSLGGGDGLDRAEMLDVDWQHV